MFPPLSLIVNHSATEPGVVIAAGVVVPNATAAPAPFAVHAPAVENLTSGGVDESKARTSVPPLLDSASVLPLRANDWNDPVPVGSTPSICAVDGPPLVKMRSPALEPEIKNWLLEPSADFRLTLKPAGAEP